MEHSSDDVVYEQPHTDKVCKCVVFVGLPYSYFITNHALLASILCVLGWRGLSLIMCYTRLQPATSLCVILLRYKGRVSAQAPRLEEEQLPGLRSAPPESLQTPALIMQRGIAGKYSTAWELLMYLQHFEQLANQRLSKLLVKMNHLTFAPGWKVAQSPSQHSAVEQERREVHGPCREPRYGIPPLPLLPHSLFLLFLFLFLFHHLNPLPPRPHMSLIK